MEAVDWHGAGLATGQSHFIGWILALDGMTMEQGRVALDEEVQAEMAGTPVD